MLLPFKFNERIFDIPDSDYMVLERGVVFNRTGRGGGNAK
jgi:hypothetical protein